MMIFFDSGYPNRVPKAPLRNPGHSSNIVRLTVFLFGHKDLCGSSTVHIAELTLQTAKKTCIVINEQNIVQAWWKGVAVGELTI